MILLHFKLVKIIFFFFLLIRQLFFGHFFYVKPRFKLTCDFLFSKPVREEPVVPIVLRSFCSRLAHRTHVERLFFGALGQDWTRIQRGHWTRRSPRRTAPGPHWRGRKTSEIGSYGGTFRGKRALKSRFFGNQYLK